MIEVTVPTSGESITEVQIGDWRKSEGEPVQRDEILVEIETDKASMDLPAPASGRLGKVLKKTGEIVKVGEVIALIDESSQAGAAAPGDAARASTEPAPAPPAPPRAAPEPPARQAEAASPPAARAPAPPASHVMAEPPKPGSSPAAPAPDAPATPAPSQEEESGDDRDAEDDGSTYIEIKPRIMPAARRALSEYGLTAADVKGSGPGGRILKEDVLRHVDLARGRQESVQQPAPGQADRAEEIVPMSLLRRRIAERLVHAQQAAALLTTFNEVDVSAVNALRRQYGDAFQEKHGVKLGFMSFFVKASIDALRLIPQINAEIRENQIVYRKYYDIGVAVGTDKGLVVPVIRNAERMSFAQLEQAIAEMANKARDGKLKVEDLQGGTFTISNGGVYGSLLSTPIVNPPQSGILGLHAIQDRPVARDGQVVIRPIMYLALTYDHRIVDGKEAVTFLRHVKDVVEDPARMLIEI